MWREAKMGRGYSGERLYRRERLYWREAMVKIGCFRERGYRGERQGWREAIMERCWSIERLEYREAGVAVGSRR